jgi:hypothetical protein
MAKNRIDHVAWVVRPENIEKYAKQLGDIFEAEFENSVGSQITSIIVYLSWEAGLELIAPLNRSDVVGNEVSDHLEKYGESPYGIIVGVEDIYQASARAQDLGYVSKKMVQSSDVEARKARYSWATKVTDLLEMEVAAPFLGMKLYYGQVDYADDVDVVSP